MKKVYEVPYLVDESAINLKTEHKGIKTITTPGGKVMSCSSYYHGIANEGNALHQGACSTVSTSSS